jgi:hypothetical protein
VELLSDLPYLGNTADLPAALKISPNRFTPTYKQQLIFREILPLQKTIQSWGWKDPVASSRDRMNVHISAPARLE